MTETSYQLARKVMQRANSLRGMISKAEGEVAKWTRMEQSHIANLKDGPARGAKVILDRALEKLNKIREEFKMLEFPDANAVSHDGRCRTCWRRIAEGETFCHRHKEQEQELINQ